MNPAKLPADRRDAICMGCHFEGRVAIQQPGRSLADFQPGDELSDFVYYFVLTGNTDDRIGALSQTEALAQSVCKRKSADKRVVSVAMTRTSLRRRSKRLPTIAANAWHAMATNSVPTQIQGTRLPRMPRAGDLHL